MSDLVYDILPRVLEDARVRELFLKHFGERAEAEASRVLEDPESYEIPDDLYDDLSDLFSTDADEILSVSWDTDFPGGSGASWLCEFGGVYFVRSTDYDTLGPFDTIDEALEADTFNMVTPHPELSSGLDDDKTFEIARGLVDWDNDVEITINDVRFVGENGEFVEVSEDDGEE